MSINGAMDLSGPCRLSFVATRIEQYKIEKQFCLGVFEAVKSDADAILAAFIRIFYG
jgi:hypothetical protein|tara:strand:- start:435 stop:605 length:171 start_codon:yes stop_codon:yes gene_type:complete